MVAAAIALLSDCRSSGGVLKLSTAIGVGRLVVVASQAAAPISLHVVASSSLLRRRRDCPALLPLLFLIRLHVESRPVVLVHKPLFAFAPGAGAVAICNEPKVPIPIVTR
jgi:hypothetical protein